MPGITIRTVMKLSMAAGKHVITSRFPPIDDPVEACIVYHTLEEAMCRLCLVGVLAMHISPVKNAAVRTATSEVSQQLAENARGGAPS